MRFHIPRSFIGIFLIIVVLASAFSVGANAIYFTIDNIPLDDLVISYPQSYGMGVVNDGEVSLSFVYSASVSLDAIEGLYIFGLPQSGGKYALYGLFILDTDASSEQGTIALSSSPSNSAVGYQFLSYYDWEYYNSNPNNYTGNFYNGTLFNYRVVRLLNTNISYSDLLSTNFQYETGNFTYDSSTGDVVKTDQHSFNFATPLSSFAEEVQNLINNLYPDRIELDHSGETTTIHNTSGNSSGGDNPGGSTSPGGDNPGGSSTGSDTPGTGSDVSTTISGGSTNPGGGPTSPVTGPDGGVIFPGGSNDYFTGLDGLLSDLDNASSVMESNQNAISENFGFVQNIFGAMFEQFPPVIVALVICAVIVLIAVKIIGR